MFTGIIEELGSVKAIDVLPDAIRLTIEGPLVVTAARRGAARNDRSYSFWWTRGSWSR